MRELSGTARLWFGAGASLAFQSGPQVRALASAGATYHFAQRFGLGVVVSYAGTHSDDAPLSGLGRLHQTLEMIVARRGRSRFFLHASHGFNRWYYPHTGEIFAGFPELDVKRYGISVGAGHHFLAKSGHVATILVECHNTFDLDRAWPIVTITFSATVLRI